MGVLRTLTCKQCQGELCLNKNTVLTGITLLQLGLVRVIGSLEQSPLSNGKHSFSSELTGTVTLVSVLSIKRKGGCVAGIEQPEHHGYRVGESSAGTAMIRDSKRQGCANPKLKNNIFSVTSHSCAGMLN
ncbi:hypothetical protein CIP107569_01099 [Corynebacterium diphtheriae]|nr:hypothetical protein FRC061569_00862 [Corynebacterium diphtheriae]CAB0506562.1 hypothetical protein FRC020322_01104 [Corynebacterium diphtheriae]CAB0506632.1 hypothetical protein FRC031641_01101 [Corynebacterium diphtheriae]CAB0506788.1 hypothetical protein FRC020338_01100 [Corynebacterium diphtheriae]CAB0550722.1 hypothetical protein CIP107522_01071 [Corynebacterium diphtheriae]